MVKLELDNPEKAISQLKAIRNSVIGSRTKKSNLVNTGIIEQLVQLLRMDLNSTAYASDLVSLSATIVASLANTPAQSTLLQLMRSGTHDALLCCLRNLSQELDRSKRHVLDQQETGLDALRLLESVLRALRSILLSVADQLAASPRWGIGSSFGTKAASSGVAIARNGSNAAASKIFGKSSRDSIPVKPAPIQDILMNSASHDDLRAKVKEQVVETEADQQRELRRLSRLFLNQIYDSSHLPYLLGPLFMCAVPLQQASAAPSASPRPGKTSLPAQSASSSASATASVSSPRISDYHVRTPALNSAATTLTTLDVESLPMTVKTRILSVIEMVCAILSATLFIPGASSVPLSEAVSSISEQISRRRERILSFTEFDSPFAPGFSTETTSRGRSEAVPVSRVAPDLQAEVIRKGSRSRSRMKDADGADTFGAPPLPPWHEDGTDELRAQSDFAPSGPASVLTVLLAAAECGFAKAQEAALYCLAEITRDEPEASLRLFHCTAPSGMFPTSVLLGLRQTSSANVRLAAFGCLANIIKVHPFTAKTNQCVLEVLMELLDYTPAGLPTTASNVPASQLQGSSQVEIQIQAAFAIARLVADNVTLQTLATESYNALQKLASLLDKACTRSQPATSAKVERANAATTILGNIAVSTPRNDASTIGVAPPTIDESAIRLREACLTALAALTFQHDEPRRKLIDTVQPPVLALVVSSISFPALGVRIAACRLSRALSRSLSILRTSIVDAGVAPKLVALLQDPAEEEVVKVEVAATICNLVLDFSPMKKVIQELGGVDTLVELAHGGALKHVDEDRGYTLQAAATVPGSAPAVVGKVSDAHAGLSGSQQLRYHALWALKNFLSHSDTALKMDLMAKLDFDFIATLCESPTVESALKEQALNIIRNAAATKESDVSFMVDGMGGGARLMSILEKCIWGGRSAGEPGAAVIEQAAFVLVNVATGTDEHRQLILRSPNIMDALGFFCNHPWKDVRVAAARCIGNLLTRSKSSSTTTTTTDLQSEVVGGDVFPDLHSEAKARLTRFGLDVKVREMAQNDVELDVRERAKYALNKLGTDAK
ncbi:Armadillo repeat-containing protein 8 [Pseudozyma hubeiensis]|nr:Armadillo repeat-containing protein 8 [Pseudozyma hubeiensis]